MLRGKRQSYLRFGLHLAAVLAFPAITRAQGPAGIGLGGSLDVGGEAERYLRAVELASGAPARWWTIRPIAPASDAFVAPAGQVWSDRWTAPGSTADGLRMLRPAARVAINSTFPAGWGPGPAWDGRGLTVEAEGGVSLHRGVLRVQLAPVAFLTQNASFALAPNGKTGDGVYRDPRVPDAIDLPQRFGSRPYGRIDYGNSTIEIRLPAMLFGVSTAAESWGPAIDYPLVLGPSSGGFTHAYVSTRTPVELGPLRLHGRLIAGNLQQSAFSPDSSGPAGRAAAGVVLAIGPRAIPGLELGVARFLETPSGGVLPEWHTTARLFSSGLSRSGTLNLSTENEMGSAFFRWAIPLARVEVYGEYYREDYSLDLRRFVQYPDDFAAYTLGLQHVLSASDVQVSLMRVEVTNGEESSSNRGERGNRLGAYTDTVLPIYQHADVRQGHTNRGLLLGSAAAFGGAGLRVTLERYTRGGRTTWTVERALRLDGLPADSTLGMDHPDVLWTVRREQTRFVGGREVTLSVAPAIDLNRNLRPGHDAFNLNASLSVRGWR